MEKVASATRSSDSLGKRSLEKRKSSGETIPAKFRSPKSPPPVNSQESMKTSYKDFVLGHEVNDVEEHFRRSLEQFNKRPQNDDPNKDVHQIIVTENTPQHSKTPSPTPQHVQYSPTFIARVPSNGTTVGVAKTQVLLSNGQHHSDVGKQPSSEGNTRPSGLPQLIPLTQQHGTSVYTSANGTDKTNSQIKALYGGSQALAQQPLVLFGANGSIPVLTRPPGMVLVNPQSDVTSLPQIMSLAASTPAIAMTGTQSYILLPQPTFQSPVGLAVTADQLALLTQQSVKTDSTDGRSSVDSNNSSSMEVRDEPVLPAKARNSSEGSDSVEEHFARALGDQWQQLKRNNPAQPSDIPA